MSLYLGGRGPLAIACVVAAISFVLGVVRQPRGGGVAACRSEQGTPESPVKRRYVVRWEGNADSVVSACECVHVTSTDLSARVASVVVDCMQTRDYEPGVVVVGADGTRHFVSCPCRD